MKNFPSKGDFYQLFGRVLGVEIIKLRRVSLGMKVLLSLLPIALLLASLGPIDVLKFIDSQLGLKEHYVLYNSFWLVFSFYVITILLSFVPVVLWTQDRRLWRLLFFIFTPLSFYIIFSTPEYSTGGWIYSAPERIDVLYYQCKMFAVSFFALLALNWSEEGYAKMNTFNMARRIGIRDFITQSLVVSSLILLTIYVVGVGDLLDGNYENHFGTSLVLSVLLFFVFYFIRISYFRLNDAGFPGFLITILFFPLFLVYSFSDLGLYFSSFYFAYFYMPAFAILCLLPSKS